jgi:hypothetical protein
VTDEEKKAAITKVKDILASYGIDMEVGACGCCRSPWVTFIHNGETILDDETGCNFNMVKS